MALSGNEKNNPVNAIQTDISKRQLLLGGLCLPFMGMISTAGSAWARADQPVRVNPKIVTGASSWTPPARANLTYKMQGRGWSGPVSGTGEIDWKFDTATSTYELDLNILAMYMSLLYASKGQFKSEIGLLPISFREKRPGRDRTVWMNYETEKVIFPWKPNEQWPLLLGTQDMNSVIMQMAHLITGDAKNAQVGRQFEFPIIRMGNVKMWMFEIMGTPEIQTKGLGTYKTWHVSRLVPENEAGSKDLRVDFWLAPQLHHLPVQMTFDMSDGTYLQASLDKVKQLVP